MDKEKPFDNKVYFSPPNPNNELIRVVFTTEDVKSLASELEVDEETAINRVLDWKKSLEENAVSSMNEQLASIIEHDQP